MMNLIGFARYANIKNKPLGDKSKKAFKFFCPIGCLLGSFLFGEEWGEDWDWFIYGGIFNLFLIIFTFVIGVKG